MPKKNIKNIKNIKNSVSNGNNIKKIRMTVPANGFEQIKSNPFFFNKNSAFFNHLQATRNRTRSTIRNNLYEDYAQKYNLSYVSQPIDYQEDRYEQMFKMRHHYYNYDDDTESSEINNDE